MFRVYETQPFDTGCPPVPHVDPCVDRAVNSFLALCRALPVAGNQTSFLPLSNPISLAAGSDSGAFKVSQPAEADDEGPNNEADMIVELSPAPAWATFAQLLSESRVSPGIYKVI